MRRWFLPGIAIAILVAAPATAQKVSRQLALTPNTVNMGTVALGTSAAAMLALTNTGNKATTLKLPPSISGGGFSCSGLPSSLGPGQSVSFQVKFTPTSVGSVNGNLSISGSGPSSPATAALTATGATPGQLTTNPDEWSFGTVTLGSSSTLPVIVTNTGGMRVTISQYSASGAGYSVGGLALPLSLAPGQQTSFSVTFAPSTTGSYNGAASLVSNATNSTSSVALSGSSVSGVGQLTPNPNTLSFGTVTVGASSTASLAVSNTGTGSATISQASVSGYGLSLSGLTLPLTLSPGAGTSFNVVFTPAAAGAVSGAVSLSSNASDSALSVSITASGGNQHYVSLSWTASTSPVVGYNVYRGAQSVGPYTQINSGVDSGTTYTDNTVQAGQTYYYVATSVNSSGAESAYSTPVQAIVPSP